MEAPFFTRKTSQIQKKEKEVIFKKKELNEPYFKVAKVKGIPG